MESDNVYNKIQEFFGGLNNNFSLMEDPVDVVTQMNYFETSGRIRTKIPLKEEDILAKKNEIFNPQLYIEDKKALLVLMAGIPNPEIYRTLENYVKNPDAELIEWAKLALQENRLLLESDLLESRQVFISTGLGGKGHKLRYFVVLINKGGNDLKPYQQKVVQDEMQYALQKHDSELEKLDFMRHYTTMRVVVPISADLTKLFRDGIDECNQFGDFLSNDFIVTNMKELSEEEINEAISGSEDIMFEDDFPPIND